MSEDKIIAELMNTARTFYEKGEIQQTLETLEQIVKIKPQFNMAWIRMAFIYGELGDFQKAIECCESVIEYNSQDRIAWNVMGAAYRDSGKYLKAIECWEKVLELDPDNDFVKKGKSVLEKRIPTTDVVELPCANDSPCPYEYNLNPERDIEGMPFIDDDPRSCPDYGHICPKFMEDMGLTTEHLDIRAVFHCAAIYIKTREMNKNLQVDEDESMKTMVEKYKEYLGKYNPRENPEYFY